MKLEPNAVLWLIGDGELKKDIESYVSTLGISNSVLFLGKRSDMPAIYSALDIFLFPSIFEGFPNAVLEAQCEGLPCLISDKITPEVLISSNAKSIGLTCAKRKWAEIIMSMCHQNIDRSKSANIIDEAGFSVENEVKRLERFYYTLLTDTER